MRIVFLLILTLFFHAGNAQHSIARQWNEVLLEAIRNDFARPTVHARNLFHLSTAMYDAWAVYDETAATYFLGNTIGGYQVEFSGFPLPVDLDAATKETLSYACYRLLHHRFRESPGYTQTGSQIDSLFVTLGFDPSFTSQDYGNGTPAALGNYIAESIIDFGLQDGSLEQFDYINAYYTPYNGPLNPDQPGAQAMLDPNRWQPLAFDVFIDQSGNVIAGSVPEFLSAEWGYTHPFSLRNTDVDIFERDGDEYWVYHDPGPPAMLDEENMEQSEHYIRNHSMVALWSSHLDPTDGVLWDISPASIGNLSIKDFPKDVEGLIDFYNEMEGGDFSVGYAVNPVTDKPYETQIVPRGDYTRVLAEFWADGPDSETPPGHWFTLLNYVSDHPLTSKKFEGNGSILSDLEWDVKAYFILGGAMHDAAIAAWGIKGYYDYVRPISAIRSMAERGQSSDPEVENYDPRGIRLVDEVIEVVKAGDPLQGLNGEHIGKIKVYAWKGPEHIEDEQSDEAGVGWILAENWWPYQRPTFVTPPFAGYVSGHSTFSRAAAEVLTSLTGSEYFPGGMGEFVARKNQFLVFEEGPSKDITLQWATYRDASDQCSLSRIWGGIHPPVDDIPGRLIGEKVGKTAFEKGLEYINGQRSILGIHTESHLHVFPNPANDFVKVNFEKGEIPLQVELFDIQGRNVKDFRWKIENDHRVLIDASDLAGSVYIIRIITTENSYISRIVLK